MVTRKTCNAQGPAPRRARWWAAVVLAALGSAPAWAGEEATLATLEGALAYAAAHHPGLAAARAERDAAEARIIPAGTLPDPMLGLAARSVEREVGIALSQTFPLAGKRQLKAAAAREEARAAENMLHARWLEVAAEVVSAFSEFAFLARARALTEENLALLKQLEEVARARYRTAQAPYADVVRAQVELGRVEDELRSLTEGESAAAGRLNAALGRSVGAPLPPLAGLPEVVQELAAEEVEAAVSAANPELAALAHQVAAAQQELEVAQRIRVPDLTVGVEVMRSGAMRRTGVGVMAGINLPIWRDCCRAEVREAAARVEASAARRAERELALLSQARLALYRFRDATRRGELYAGRLIPQSQQALAAMVTAYRAGEATFADLVETSRMALEFQLARERARVEQLQQLAELERLTGRRWWPQRRGEERDDRP